MESGWERHLNAMLGYVAAHTCRRSIISRCSTMYCMGRCSTPAQYHGGGASTMLQRGTIHE